MNNKIGHEIITLFEIDRKNPKLDELAAKILSDSNFDFDIHEDKVIDQNKSKWNNEYYKDHIALLNTNFSKERLKHCLELRDYFGEKPLKKKTFLMIFITISFIILCLVLFFILNSPNNSSSQKNQDLNSIVKDDNTTLK